MIDCLIFSKDRAAQLDLLLRSIDRYAPGRFTSVSVLYETSDFRGPFSEGYSSRHSYLPACGGVWIRQSDFDEDVRGWLRAAPTGTVCFLVDDDVFYAPAPEPAALPWSFRGGDFFYPFTLDGGVYAKEEILPYLAFPFANPTQLEAGVHGQLGEDAWTIHHGAGCLVGIPHNVVSDSSGNACMGGSAAELNERFLAGERISLEHTVARIDPSGPVHQQVEYVWEKR